MAKFNKDIVKLASDNDFFQKEVYLDKRIQIVLMSLLPGEEIGEETHRADQTTFFVSGDGQAVLDGKGTKVGTNRLLVIPQGTRHNIINKGTTPLKLFSVYAPPAEPAGVAHKTKAAAEEAEKSVVAKAVDKVKKALKGEDKSKKAKAKKAAKK